MMCTAYATIVYTVRMSDVKRRVLEAAKTLYAENGYAGLSMRKVAKTAGVSTMASYRHYENKDHLLHALQVHAFEVYVHKYLRPLLSIDDPWDAALASMMAYGAFALEDSAYFKIAFMATDQIKGLKTLTDEGKASIEEAFRIPLMLTTKVVGKEAGMQETIRAWSMMHGLLALHLAGRLRFMQVDFVEYYRVQVERYVEELRARSE